MIDDIMTTQTGRQPVYWTSEDVVKAMRDTGNPNVTGSAVNVAVTAHCSLRRGVEPNAMLKEH